MKENKFIYVAFLILILLGMSIIVFPNKWKNIINPPNNNIKVIELELKNEELRKLNQSIQNERDSLRLLAIQDSLEIVELQQEGLKIDTLLAKKDKDILRTKGKLGDVLAKQNETKDKINHIKSAPNQKRGEELIFSIGNRLKK
jgi:hypothetical protein